MFVCLDLTDPPPGVNTNVLDDVFLEVCLQGLSDQPLVSPSCPPLHPNSTECINTMALDDPFFVSFTDISSLLDSVGPAMEDTSPLSVGEGGLTYDLSDATFGSPSTDLASGLSSPLNDVLTSTPPSPFSPTLDKNNRKRSTSSIDSDASKPDRKIPCVNKEAERRVKNNAASRVSRAKRRAKTSSLFEREKHLVEENARLRQMVDEMTQEAEKLRSLLVTKLAH